MVTWFGQKKEKKNTAEKGIHSFSSLTGREKRGNMVMDAKGNPKHHTGAVILL